MSADYYFFAPTGGRYQTVFRGTLPRRYSIRRSRKGNAVTVALNEFVCLSNRLIACIFLIFYFQIEIKFVVRC